MNSIGLSFKKEYSVCGCRTHYDWDTTIGGLRTMHSLWLT